ncbi:MAG: carboxymuconolactone decarboxylase family protein [Dongiaceae bacterium]
MPSRCWAASITSTSWSSHALDRVTAEHKGVLPHELKEMVRIRMSVAQHCGYCSSIRTARGKDEGSHRGTHRRNDGLRGQQGALPQGESRTAFQPALPGGAGN